MNEQTVDPESPEWEPIGSFIRIAMEPHWWEIYGGPWDGVVGYVEIPTIAQRAEMALVLRRLLFLCDEEQLRVFSRGIGMALHPDRAGWSYTRWFTGVLRHLEDPVAYPGPPEHDLPLPEPTPGARVSTYTDEPTADAAAAANLEGNRHAVEAWTAASPRQRNRAFEWTHPEQLGRMALPGAASSDDIVDVHRSRVILRRDPGLELGWFILVTYPIGEPDPRVASAIDRAAPEWDALWTLCGGYLHQDYDDYGGAAGAGAVIAFGDEALPGQPAAAGAAIERLLALAEETSDGAAGDVEAYLAQACTWLGMDYHPPFDRLTFRDWLAATAAQLTGTALR